MTMTYTDGVLTLAGTIDEYAVDDLRQRLAELADDDLVAVDLTAVDFLPSAGIGVLVKARSTVKQRGGSLDLVAPEGTPAQQVLRITGLPHVTERP